MLVLLFLMLCVNCEDITQLQELFYEENNSQSMLTDSTTAASYSYILDENEKSLKTSLLRRQRVKSESTRLLSTTDRFNIDDDDDEANLKSRKVWSRWSKWAQCSVTCGEGVITRRKVCVAGHCAPGEFEEQRRPCHRATCCNLLTMEDLPDQD